MTLTSFDALAEHFGTSGATLRQMPKSPDALTRRQLRNLRWQEKHRHYRPPRYATGHIYGDDFMEPESGRGKGRGGMSATAPTTRDAAPMTAYEPRVWYKIDKRTRQYRTVKRPGVEHPLYNVKSYAK